jgi:hypothetical protein
MPGIVGIVSQRPSEECKSLVKSMASSMEHESFYDSGHVLGARDGHLRGLGGPRKFLAPGSLSSMNRGILHSSSQGSASWIPKREPASGKKGHELRQAAGSWLGHLYEEGGQSFPLKN